MVLWRLPLPVEFTLDRSLPERLQQRVRVVVETDSANRPLPQPYVLYWMHHCVRAHENPALDVAICLARQNGWPLLVYHALSEDYPYASDRHHAFILQGARDVQREMADRGIAYCFHLQRNGHRGPHLRDLVRGAAVLVTEEMPVQPVLSWLDRLCTLTTTPMLSVDTSCIVTPSLVPKCHTRAFEFRDATKKLYAAKVSLEYVEQDVDCPMFRLNDKIKPLPFEPLDLQDVSLSTLVAECRIDHLVAPVADTPGGSRSGYARWQRFKQSGLASYAKRRNNAAIHEGVSRLSAYLHYGMVSSFRIAREANELSAEKFLDELLLWRELSFHFCYHKTDTVDSLEAIPSWAIDTLREHQSDRREQRYSWETLARGETNEELWNACQMSLLRHGELHNNLRMTWGKALLSWTDSPERALHLLIDLNHRYALDGRDPNSYGGILWCLGQFDRPFSPPQEILGSVRPRPIQEHASRLDRVRFRSITERPIAATSPRVTIIGAGLAGLIAARTLSDHGVDVRVLEKSRDVGGRLATRQTSAGLAMDHGAQYFTARDPRFAKYVQSWMHDSIVEPWLGRIVELDPDGEVCGEKRSQPRYVGVGGMKMIARHLSNGLDIAYESEVTALKRHSDGRWNAIGADDDDVLSTSDVVITNCPPPQSLGLLEGHTDLSGNIAAVQMQPCWAVMLQTSALDDVPLDGAFINDFALSWIARDSSKPGRASGTTTWVLHASTPWSVEHLDASPDRVQHDLLAALSQIMRRPINDVPHCVVHRWLYASPVVALEDECLWDAAVGLGACGDWCGGPRVEGAFLSGSAMAGTLLRQWTIDRPAATNVSQFAFHG